MPIFAKDRRPESAAPARTAQPAAPAPRAARPAEPPREDRARQRRERLAEIKLDIHKALLDTLNLAAIETASEADLRAEIAAIAAESLDEMGAALNREERAQLTDDLYDEVRGLGPLEALLKDDSVNDILVNGPRQVFVERAGRLQLTDVAFKDERHLLRIIDKIVSAVGRRVDESNPYVDARLADGSRFNAMVPPVAVDGSLVSIRKFRKDKLGIGDLVRFGAFSEDMARYLEAAVATRLNVIVSGGTGSGKTTTLNALSSFIGGEERVLTIEDTAELQLQQTHVGRMESRPPNVEGKGAVTQRDCLRNALRMRPDRIIVGETRGEEVIDMLQAMNTGHDGSMTTIHANSARDAVSRLENMVAMAGIEMPLKAIRGQIASAVNLVVQASRLQDGSRRMTSITEITGMEGEVLTMQEVFRFQRTGLGPESRILGRFTATGVRSRSSERFRLWGHDLPPEIYEPARGRADALVRGGRVTEGLAAWEAVVARPDATDDDRVELAGALVRADEWERARAVLATVPPTHETFERLRLEAVVADAAGEWARADSFYATAVGLTTTPAGVLNNWGYSQLTRGDYAAAERLLQDALLHDPQLFTAKNNLVLARAAQRTYQLPVVPMTQEERARLLHTMGLAAVKQNDVAMGRSLLREAVETHPRHFEEAARALEALEGA